MIFHAAPRWLMHHIIPSFPAQKPVTRSFDIFFDLRLNKWLRKQSWGWWFEMPSRPLWLHYDVIVMVIVGGGTTLYLHKHANVSLDIYDYENVFGTWFRMHFDIWFSGITRQFNGKLNTWGAGIITVIGQILTHTVVIKAYNRITLEWISNMRYMWLTVQHITSFSTTYYIYMISGVHIPFIILFVTSPIVDSALISPRRYTHIHICI